MFICEILVVRLVFSSILHTWYVEVRISRSVSAGPFDFEITRVDCIFFSYLSYDKFSDRAAHSSLNTHETMSNII